MITQMNDKPLKGYTFNIAQRNNKTHERRTKVSYFVPATEGCSYRQRMKLESVDRTDGTNGLNLAKTSVIRVDTEQLDSWARSCPPECELIIQIEFLD